MESLIFHKREVDTHRNANIGKHRRSCDEEVVKIYEYTMSGITVKYSFIYTSPGERLDIIFARDLSKFGINFVIFVIFNKMSVTDSFMLVY